MGHGRSLGQYRALDLGLFCLMLLIFEYLVMTASTRWFPAQPYTVSLIPLLFTVVLVRWGVWAALPGLLGGLWFCYLSGAEPSRYAVFCIGNLLPLLLIPFLASWRKEKGSFSGSLPAVGLGVAVLLLMQGGRALVSLLFGADPALLPGFFTTEVVTDLFTLVVLWILRRLDGMLEDQRHYLQRLREEEARS